MREPLKLLLPMALALVASGCGTPKRDTNYRDAQLKVGMSDEEIKSKFGEPDSYDDGWAASQDGGGITHRTTGEVILQRTNYEGKYPFHVEKLGYGPIPGDAKPAKYQMELTFVAGYLKRWKKSTGDEPKK